MPHCMLFANTVYDWPFDAIHARGDAITVLDDHNHQPHMESCDPGIFPSFFYDYSKPAGRQAYLDIIGRFIVNGSADGVYSDCYVESGLRCGRADPSNCTAKRNGTRHKPPARLAHVSTPSRAQLARADEA